MILSFFKTNIVVDDLIDFVVDNRAIWKTPTIGKTNKTIFSCLKSLTLFMGGNFLTLYLWSGRKVYFLFKLQFVC